MTYGNFDLSRDPSHAFPAAPGPHGEVVADDLDDDFEDDEDWEDFEDEFDDEDDEEIEDWGEDEFDDEE